jgi:hypothetical protein
MRVDSPGQLKKMRKLLLTESKKICINTPYIIMLSVISPCVMVGESSVCSRLRVHVRGTRCASVEKTSVRGWRRRRSHNKEDKYDDAVMKA